MSSGSLYLHSCSIFTIILFIRFLLSHLLLFLFFFFNDTATTEIYTLSLHDALPIYGQKHQFRFDFAGRNRRPPRDAVNAMRSEEHTSELQSLTNLVCRLLLEKKKKTKKQYKRNKKTYRNKAYAIDIKQTCDEPRSRT